ncbi:hypothetical protein GCM10010177_10080 [Actinomadura citrea]|nr:hypothetical protein GCM10010177_10080 [Actinomadura citrea]
MGVAHDHPTGIRYQGSAHAEPLLSAGAHSAAGGRGAPGPPGVCGGFGSGGGYGVAQSVA